MDTNSTRYADQLRKKHQLQGPVRLDLPFSVIPTQVLENDRPEDFYLRKEQLCSGQASATSGAGTAPEVGIFNPLGSGIMAVITRAAIMASAAVTAFRFLLAADPVGDAGYSIKTQSLRDLRFRGPAGPFSGNPGFTACHTFSAAPAVTGSGLAADHLLQFETASLIEGVVRGGEIILMPGTGVEWGLSAVGVQFLALSLDWYERQLGTEA